MVVEQKVLDLQMNTTDDEPLCAFSIINGSNPNTYNVGEDFLRHAYSVFDMHNNAVALAQARADSDALNNSKLVPFVGHGAPIPSAGSVTDQPSVIRATLPTTTSSWRISSTYAAALSFSLVLDTSATQHGSAVQDHGFNVASILGVASVAAMVVVISVATGHSIYYHQKKLKLGLRVCVVHTPASRPFKSPALNWRFLRVALRPSKALTYEQTPVGLVSGPLPLPMALRC